jgi:parallel beta-helix repeat protein
MKRILIALLLLPGWASAATYYVDCNAGAGGDGSLATPWDAVADVNGASFSAGDSVLFAKGCTWRESLVPPSNGASGNPITFGAYGTGADPIINGSALRTGWTAYTGETGDLVTDNFDDGDTTGWTKAGGGTQTVSVEQAHSGTYSVKSTTANTTLYQSFAGQGQIWFRAYVYPTANASATTELFTVRVGAVNKVLFFLGAGSRTFQYWNLVGASGASGTEAMNLNAWNLIEGSVKKGAADGEIHLKVNGTVSIAATGLNCGTDDFTRLDFGTLTTDLTVYFDDVDVDSTGYLGALDTTGATNYVVMADDPNAVASDGVLREEKLSVAALATDSWFYDAGDTRLYYKTDGVKAISSYSIESPASANTVYLNDKDHITFDGLRFQGPSIYDGIYGDHGGEGLTVQNCTFANFYGPGMEITGGAGDNLGITISGNTFADAGRQYDVYLYPNAAATSVATVSDNATSMTAYQGDATLPDSSQRKFAEFDNVDSLLVQGNTVTFPAITGDTSTILATGCAAPVVERNSITGGNHGIVVHDAPSGGIVRYNRLVSTYDDGIWAYGTSDGVEVYYNVVSGSYDDGIDIDSATGSVISNNTVYGSRDTGIVIRSGSEGAILKNNLTSENGQPGTPTTGDEGGHEILVSADSATGFVADNNLYYHTTAKVTATPFSWGGTSYSFANWKVQSTEDAAAVNADPLFVSSSDFRLQAGSPAINAGVGVGLLTDFAGTALPIGSAPDIGAYENLDPASYTRIDGGSRVLSGGHTFP